MDTRMRSLSATPVTWCMALESTTFDSSSWRAGGPLLQGGLDARPGRGLHGGDVVIVA